MPVYMNGAQIHDIAIKSETKLNTEDTTATSLDILKGKTAYTSNGKITGSLPLANFDSSAFFQFATYVSNNGQGNIYKLNLSDKTIAIPDGTAYFYADAPTDTTATAADIECGETAYINGKKIIGTKQLKREHIFQSQYIDQSFDSCTFEINSKVSNKEQAENLFSPYRIKVESVIFYGWDEESSAPFQKNYDYYIDCIDGASETLTGAAFSAELTVSIHIEEISIDAGNNPVCIPLLTVSSDSTIDGSYIYAIHLIYK